MKNLCTHAFGQSSPATVPVASNSENSKAFSRKPNRILVTLLSVSLLLLSQFSTAQAPQQFSFQGVARGADGKVVANSSITVRIKIHKDSPNGQVVFSEMQILTTNSTGVFDLVVGGLTGGLDDVNWASDNCFIETEIDITGGANFVSLGTTSIKSVPYALVSRQWINNSPIVQTGILGSGPSLPQPIVGSNLIWYPKKAAFRVGAIDLVDYWADDKIGVQSFAAGFNSRALGTNSFAGGAGAYAGKLGSVAIGTGATADADHSVALGRIAKALGENSISLGLETRARSVGGAAIGAYNNDSDLPGNPSPSDRIFQVGNGTSENNRSNALTILRNGNMGIGNNALSPQYPLDLAGRMRIRHNGETAGIYLNNSANVTDGFVGMKTDDEIGFFINGFWRFWINSSNAFVNGAIVNTSDRRLKERITPLSASLPSLSSLKGYHYFWKHQRQGRELQTGLIAQEVEQMFPELVTTDKDGYKAVNYIGLIPHLIEAVKELDQRTAEITELKKELAQAKELNKRISDLETGLKSFLTQHASATGKSQAK